jgi:hypothetical protein
MLKPILTIIIFLFLFTTFIHIFIHSQTSYGDQLRHRPGWLLVVNTIIPQFNIDPNFWGSSTNHIDNNKSIEQQGLEILIQSLNTEAKLTGFGKLFAMAVIHDHITAKQCIEKEMAKSPLNSKLLSLSRPTYIVLGLPRTGTTFLHQLLSIDKNLWRAPRFHEYMDPCPTPAHHRRRDRGIIDYIRIYIQSIKMSFLRILLPNLSHLHHMDSETPEEDVAIMAQTMTSVEYPTVFFVPTYTKWLQNNHPLIVNYGVQYLHSVLENHFRRVSEPEDINLPWLLKTPQHLIEMPALLKYFGNVKFIWLHRDPLQSLSSVVSVVCSMIGIGTDELRNGTFVRKVSTETVQFWKWALQQATKDRLENSILDKSIYDVQFNDLIHNPLQSVKTLYQHFGLQLQPQIESEMDIFIKNWSQQGFTGKHKHPSLERFGVETKYLKQDMIDQWWNGQ